MKPAVTVNLPGRVHRGEPPTAEWANSIRQAIAALAMRGVDVPNMMQGAPASRFKVTVGSKIRVAEGVIAFLRRGTGGNELVRPIFPTLNGVALNDTDEEEDRPGFSIEGLLAETKYSIILRYFTDFCKGTFGVFDSGGDDTARIVLLPPDELSELDLDADERAVLIAELTLQEQGEILVVKKLDQFISSDWLHACGGNDDSDDGITSSDESIPLGSDDDDNSDSAPDSDSDSDSDSGGSGDPASSASSDDDEHAGSECPVRISARWQNKPSCVNKPAFGTTKSFRLTVNVTISFPEPITPEIGGGLCDRCDGNWWANVRLASWTPVEGQVPSDSEIVGDEVHFPIGCGGTFPVTFKLNPFVPCAKYDFSVLVKSPAPASPGSDPDRCCGKTLTPAYGAFVMPGWCGEGCTTLGPTLSDGSSGP